MKRFYKNIWMLGILCAAFFALCSCMNEDDRIGNNIGGHWFGDMDMFFDGERAQGSEIEFYNNGWGYDRGTGVQIDYYRRHAVTSHFDWRVQGRVIYLTFREDPNLDCAIVDYTIGYDYFRGYIADYYTLENVTYFDLRSYDRYWDSYGYGYYEYYDYYVKGQTRAVADSTIAVSDSTATTTYHGIRGVNMKK